VTVTLLNAVGRSLAGKIMPLHNARKTATLGRGSDINSLHFSKNIDRNLSTHRKRSSTAEFANKSLGLTASLLNRSNARGSTSLRSLAVELRDMTTLGANRQATRLVIKPKLNRLIPISLKASHLQHTARTCLDNRNGNGSAVLAINLRHADLTAEYPA
jgi:hypothetical protein